VAKPVGRYRSVFAHHKARTLSREQGIADPAAIVHNPFLNDNPTFDTFDHASG